MPELYIPVGLTEFKYIYDGIWLLVQHASNPLLSFAYSCHNPLFALVSGFVLWHQKFPPLSSQITGRVRGLAIPYFAWFVVIYCLHRGFSGVLTNVPGAWSGGDEYQRTWRFVTPLYAAYSSLVDIFLARLSKPEWLLLASGIIVPIAAGLLPPEKALIFDTRYLKEAYPFVELGYRHIRTRTG